VAILAIGADVTQLSEFRDVFGMRFLGLIDPSSSVYNAWRVPNPTAPYPQDYIIDQQGRVAYWNDQYDPQEVIATIDRLLNSGVGERVNREVGRVKQGQAVVRGTLLLPSSPFTLHYSLFGPSGQKVADLKPGANDVRHLAPGVYFIVAPHPYPLPQGERESGWRAANGDWRVTSKVVVTE
jgi:hypothetical protein